MCVISESEHCGLRFFLNESQRGYFYFLLRTEWSRIQDHFTLVVILDIIMFVWFCGVSSDWQPVVVTVIIVAEVTNLWPSHQDALCITQQEPDLAEPRCICYSFYSITASLVELRSAIMVSKYLVRLLLAARSSLAL